MQLNACNNNGPHESGSSLPTALQLVTALTEEQHQQLRDFAAKRLRRIQGSFALDRCLAGKTPDDLVDGAIEKVLLGDTHPRKGRRLSPKNRQSQEAFALCLMGIINSDLSHLVSSAEAAQVHLPIGDGETEPGLIDPVEPLLATGAVERRDLQHELFRRLRRKAPRELMAAVDSWERTFLEDDRIGQGEFDRRVVHRVRRLAQEIMAELAREVQPLAPTGMEMLI